MAVQDVRETPGALRLFGDLRFDRPVRGSIELPTFFGDETLWAGRGRCLG